MSSHISFEAEHLPLTPAAFYILLALADGERHGYAIAQDVARFSNGAVRLGPGTLYRTIKHLLDAGLITDVELRPEIEDDERRRYYRISEQGRALAMLEAQRLAQLVELARARRLLNSGESALGLEAS
jgi:DNA-binding PadR family transcriptional regulator